ncbi:hypothetical protein [Wohlfahrtiimonas populi]|uniref:hypothetical protein n=1 Tax=Wohlfahrtiimonas populi TaxID=1940240 RepID=UPI00098D651A|nr:hypothetical protein [Wohlfahrtiimonas populi]
MVKYRDQKSKTKFSRFLALSLCAWLIIAMIACAALFYYQYKLNFKTSFTQVNSYFTIYQQRELILLTIAIFIALFVLIIYIRIFAFKMHLFLKLFLLLIPSIFIAALALLSFNIYLILLELNIPLGQGIFAFKKYLQNFSWDQVTQAITALPYQLYSIEIPLYGVIYSYLAMFILVIFSPLQISFSANSLWKKFNTLLALSFVILFGTSAYYLIINFIINDPFLPYKPFFQLL